MSGGPVTVPSLRARKRRNGDTPIVMVTAYDEPGARIVSDAGADIILVGDSVANTVLGYPDTLHVDIDVMAHHTAAVARAEPRCLILGDMPWMSYHLTSEDAVRNAATLIRAGAQAVKLEGGRARIPVVEAIVKAEIPVMGHLGLTPQSVLAMGGFRVQGKSADAATALLDAAKALAASGCFGFVIEGVPDVVGAAVTEALDVPTIGIGAGPACDGQVLVFHDLLGLGKQRAAQVRPPVRRRGSHRDRGDRRLRRRRAHRGLPGRGRDVPRPAGPRRRPGLRAAPAPPFGGDTDAELYTSAHPCLSRRHMAAQRCLFQAVYGCTSVSGPTPYMARDTRVYRRDEDPAPRTHRWNAYPADLPSTGTQHRILEPTTAAAAANGTLPRTPALVRRLSGRLGWQFATKPCS